MKNARITFDLPKPLHDRFLECEKVRKYGKSAVLRDLVEEFADPLKKLKYKPTR